eukprot:IDg9110t1
MATFLDDHSRHLTLAFLCSKSEVADAFVAFKSKLESMMRHEVGTIEMRVGSKDTADAACASGDAYRVLRLHSDNAAEYRVISSDSRSSGVEQSFSPPYTPEHNAIAERVNRTIVEPARSMWIQANLPHCLWPYAVKNVVSVRNRLPHSATRRTPHELVTGLRPSLKNTRSLDHGIYKILIMAPQSLPRVVKSRHVTFDEDSFPGFPDLEEHTDDDHASDATVDSLSMVDDFESDSVPNSDDNGDVSEEDCESSGAMAAMKTMKSHMPRRACLIFRLAPNRAGKSRIAITFAC